MPVALGIIGGGVMGEALLSRLLAQNIYAPPDVLVSEPQETRRNFLVQKYGVEVTTENGAIAQSAEILLLAIKPQMFDAVAKTLSPSPAAQLVVSILAGTPLHKLESAFPDQPIIRAMPNTPATVGAGMTAIAANAQVTPQQIETARRLFAAVGEVVEVPESLIDAVTGVSGSGPGYIAIVIEALSDGGVAVGLPRAIATQLAIQTVLGTAELLRSSQIHPAELKDRVTSPGGTTIAGIAQLEQAGVRSAFIEAVRAACAKAKELGS